MATSTNRNYKPVLLGFLSAAMMIFMFWLGGFDFDRRGAPAVFAAFYALVGFALGFCAGKLLED